MSLAKLKILIWKNILLQRRHKWQTLFEILSPVIFSFLLIYIRCLVDPESKPSIVYQAFEPTHVHVNKHLENFTISRNTNLKVGKIAYSPDTPLTKKVTQGAMLKVIKENMNAIFILLFDDVLPQAKGFKSAKEMEQKLIQPNAMHEYVVGIQFDDAMANATEWSDDIVVTLRFPAIMRTPMITYPLKASWRTNLLFPIFPRPGPREPEDRFGGKLPGYAAEMFLPLQHALSLEIIEQKTGKPVNTKVYLQRFPQMAYNEDNLLIALERFISMILMLCFAYTFVNTVRVVTAEKELQLKETMIIMGLPPWLHWLAWFLKQFSYLFISVILMVILFKMPISLSEDGHRYAVITYTSWSVLLFFMVLFVIASITFCFMVSVFFTRANTAASFTGLAWFSTYSVFMLTQVVYENISDSTKLGLSLISNTAIGYVFQMIIMCEGTSKGLQWDGFFSPVSYNEKFYPAHLAGMLIIDSILYMLVALYVEKISPGVYGVPLPWYFPFTKSFWRVKKYQNSDITKMNILDKDYRDALLKVVHGEEPEGAKVGVNLQNLTKIYKAKKKAVDNLNLRMYENEITVLLGHNGAGKTTTISMLTGTIPPSSGSAIINGYDIVRETKQARRSIGICPQHNVLFPDLTVSEHIIFYSRLKGVPKARLEHEVNHFLKLLDLEEKRNELSSKLSGGQKRRLSVGAALCGEARVVLLDEPSSGLDPAARRTLWDLLHREKKGRTMIITTHFMDEAEIVGDRVAIMAGGKLQCVGSPYFLKRHYGIGYKMTIVKEGACDVTAVTCLLQAHIPDVKENTNIGSELTYILPNEHVNKFPSMLKEFEERKQSLSISSYGLSVSSLEEVFMKVGAEDVENLEDGSHAIALSESAIAPLDEYLNNTGETVAQQKVTGIRLLKNRIYAMFLKLSHNTLRNKLSVFLQFVTPIVNITISVIIARSWKFISHLPPLTLSLESGFKATNTLLSEGKNLTSSSIESKAMVEFKNYFKTSVYPKMTLTDIGNVDMGNFYLKMSASDLSRVRYENLVGATFNQGSITGWFSNYGYHDPAISLALVDDAIMRAHSPNTSLKFVNYPLPYTIDNLIKIMASGSSMGFQFAFNIGFCMAFVSSFLVLFPIKERITGAKLAQRIWGVRAGVMWGAALLWDWAWLMLVHCGTLLTLALYQEDTLSTPAELGRVLLVLTVFSIAMIPLHYLASFFFDSPATGFAKMCYVNMFLGAMPFLITEVLRLPEVGSPYYAHLFDWIFSPLPIYCLSRSFRDMSVSSFSILACDMLCEQLLVPNCTRHTICHKMNQSICCIEDDPYLKWSEPGIGRYLFMMTLVGVVSFSILMLKEYDIFKKLIPSQIVPLPPDPIDDDADVSRARREVSALSRLSRMSRDVNPSPLVCQDLTKYYGKRLAVNRLTFQVGAGECFGLLGVNGAGKTSAFRVLTGDAAPSAGDALVCGRSLRGPVRQVHANIGYCPQFDPLLENLTARETLRIASLVRGEPPTEGARRALRLARALGFLKHYDKKIQQCSGGTKRKISTALALLGDAPLVLLDEPTTGMDPASKRLVWRAVCGAARGGRSAVLTSHSMEECEALCSRLAVMAAARLRCLGPLQHLKNKFSQGYTIIVKCKQAQDKESELAKIKQFMMENFQDVRLIETYLSTSTFRVSDRDSAWWRVFEGMERARGLLALDDYSVSQTSLEQVFMAFAHKYDADQ